MAIICAREVCPSGQALRTAQLTPCVFHSLFKDCYNMRKIVLAAAAAAGVLALSACSEKTEHAADATVDSAASDAAAAASDAAASATEAAGDAAAAAGGGVPGVQRQRGQ